MENIQNLPKHQQQQLEQHLVNSQVKDSLTTLLMIITGTHACFSNLTSIPCTPLFIRMYMGLVERCFDTCVNNFRNKTLDKHESKCLENCSERYIKSANRTGLRFQEHQALQMKRAQDMANGARGTGM
eukprot:scaffold8671_cov210-Chaetoceros_neogracile.AAC.1